MEPGWVMSKEGGEVLRATIKDQEKIRKKGEEEKNHAGEEDKTEEQKMELEKKEKTEVDVEDAQQDVPKK
jgi:hypothetical protein